MCSKEAVLASIRKRQNRWEVRVRRGNNPAKCKSFTKLTDAKIWAYQTELALERASAGIATAPIKLSLIKAKRRYIDSIVSQHKGKDSETYRLDAIINRLGGNRDIKDISPSDIAQYRDTRLKVVSSGTVRRELVIISGLFNTAISEWNMTYLPNPVRGVKMPPDSPKRTRRLNQYEKALLLSQAKFEACREVYLAILIATETGMRQSEILRLISDDIDFEKRMLLVKETKNGEDRTIPISRHLVSELSSFFNGTSSGFMLTRSGLRQAFRRLTRKLHIENLRFHDLRHEALSHFFELGLSVPEVQLISGHKTVDQLMRYSHARVSEIRDKLDNADERGYAKDRSRVKREIRILS
jgi:integrase